MAKRQWIDLVLSHSPAQLLFQLGAHRALVALAYHDILDESRFLAQITWLARNAKVVSAEDVCRALRGDCTLPKRAVLITFDDGDRTVYDVGLPILRKLGLPAVTFIVTGLVDTDEPFWWVEVEELVRNGARFPGVDFSSGREVVRWIKKLPNDERLAALDILRQSASTLAEKTPQLTRDELRELDCNGIEIGNHTFSHPNLSQCDAATVEAEVRTGHGILAEILGRPPRLFAYPGGDRHPKVPSVLRALDYQAGFLFDHRIGPFPPRDPLAISRVRVNSTTSMNRYRTIMSGLHPFIHRARGLS
jgi:peptidoglycan/xylan/chitin deacetylase (PgdA/CDA1 family)